MCCTTNVPCIALWAWFARHAHRALSTGVRLLEYAVDNGWSATSSCILEGMLAVHGLDFGSVLQLAKSDQLTLLYRWGGTTAMGHDT